MNEDNETGHDGEERTEDGDTERSGKTVKSELGVEFDTVSNELGEAMESSGDRALAVLDSSKDDTFEETEDTDGEEGEDEVDEEDEDEMAKMEWRF